MTNSKANEPEQKRAPRWKVFTCPLCGSFTRVDMELQPDFDIRKACCDDRATRFLHGSLLPEERND